VVRIRPASKPARAVLELRRTRARRARTRERSLLVLGELPNGGLVAKCFNASTTRSCAASSTKVADGDERGLVRRSGSDTV
jgi:hypothetical protein